MLLLLLPLLTVTNCNQSTNFSHLNISVESPEIIIVLNELVLKIHCRRRPAFKLVYVFSNFKVYDPYVICVSYSFSPLYHHVCGKQTLRHF